MVNGQVSGFHVGRRQATIHVKISAEWISVQSASISCVHCKVAITSVSKCVSVQFMLKMEREQAS